MKNINIEDFTSIVAPVMHKVVKPDASQFVVDSIIYNLYKSYNEEHRKYHNTYHIWYIFKSAERYEIKLTNVQKLAIIWHDYCYDLDIKTPINENRSAEALLSQLYGLVNSNILGAAANIIMDTAEHFNASPNVGLDSKVILDLDISGMYDGYPEFLRQNSLVEEEFGLEPTSEARINFLKFFLSKEKILLSDQLKHLEPKLRSNIERLLTARLT